MSEMTDRERVYTVLNFKEPDRLPRDYWGYWDDIDRTAKDTFFANYPWSIEKPSFTYGESLRKSGVGGRSKGKRIDEWGCGWEAGEDGVVGEVKNPPIRSKKDLDGYIPPYELLEGADLSDVSKIAETSNSFLLQPWGTGPNPFERMQYLRGTEQLLMDIAYGDEIVYRLRDIVHEYFKRQIEIWASSEVDALFMMDDWGSQQSLLISPQIWREVFKPLYHDYCAIADSVRKPVFFHSDGRIIDIFDDLIEIGVKAINCQLAVNGLEEVVEKYRGRIVFWGDVDRQWIMPFGKPEDVSKVVRKTAELVFPIGKTGVIPALGRTKGDPIENFTKVFEEWDNVFSEYQP